MRVNERTRESQIDLMKRLWEYNKRYNEYEMLYEKMNRIYDSYDIDEGKSIRQDLLSLESNIEKWKDIIICHYKLEKEIDRLCGNPYDRFDYYKFAQLSLRVFMGYIRGDYDMIIDF